MLVQVHATAWLAVPAMVIVSREITVSALREWMAELGQRTSVAVSYVGKVKTVFQMLAIFGLLAVDPARDDSWLVWSCYIMLYTAAVLTIWSMFIYLKASWEVMKGR